MTNGSLYIWINAIVNDWCDNRNLGSTQLFFLAWNLKTADHHLKKWFYFSGVEVDHLVGVDRQRPRQKSTRCHAGDDVLRNLNNLLESFDNTYLLCLCKYLCTTDLQLDWFGIDKVKLRWLNSFLPIKLYACLTLAKHFRTFWLIKYLKHSDAQTMAFLRFSF